MAKTVIKSFIKLSKVTQSTHVCPRKIIASWRHFSFGSLSLSIYSFTALYLLPVVLYALSTYGKCHVKWKLLAPDIRENETLYRRPKMNTAANAHTSKYTGMNLRPETAHCSYNARLFLAKCCSLIKKKPRSRFCIREPDYRSF